MSNFYSSSSAKSHLESLLNEDEAFWREIIKLFSQEDNFVLLIGKPSIRKMHEREAAEEKLITDRKIALGDEGLAEKAQFLKDAKAANDAKKIPNAVLAKIPIPSVDSIILSEVITLGSRRLHPEGTQTNKEKNYAHITRHTMYQCAGLTIGAADQSLRESLCSVGSVRSCWRLRARVEAAIEALC